LKKKETDNLLVNSKTGDPFVPPRPARSSLDRHVNQSHAGIHTNRHIPDFIWMDRGVQVSQIEVGMLTQTVEGVGYAVMPLRDTYFLSSLMHS